MKIAYFIGGSISDEGLTPNLYFLGLHAEALEGKFLHLVFDAAHAEPDFPHRFCLDFLDCLLGAADSRGDSGTGQPSRGHSVEFNEFFEDGEAQQPILVGFGVIFGSGGVCGWDVGHIGLVVLSEITIDKAIFGLGGFEGGKFLGDLRGFLLVSNENCGTEIGAVKDEAST